MLHGLNTVLISLAVQQDFSQKFMVHCIALGHEVQHQAPAELMFTGLHYRSLSGL